MRLVLLASIAFIPTAALAQPQCVIADPPARPLRIAEVSVPMPQPAAADVFARPLGGLIDPALPPVLQHVAATGSQLTELGTTHGLRRVVARNGQQTMLLHVVPDGTAAIGGIISDLTLAEFTAIFGGQTRELGLSHGLRGIFASNGGQFQVFYVTPDGERVIPGAMWDATGKNVTKDQVATIPGVVASVEIGPGAEGVPVDGPPQAGSLVAVAQATTSGLMGDPAAPKVWMFVDPMCSFSVRALQQLQPLIAAKRLQVAVIPIAILDHEDAGRSTSSALAMLSQPPDQMIAAWTSGRLDAPPSPDAPARLAANRTAADAIALRGTPTLVWRKADGTEGRADGLPADLNAVVASIGR